ncbi:MAG: N-6 DNA methylase, partial [Chloroflexota bacterium]
MSRGCTQRASLISRQCSSWSVSSSAIISVWMTTSSHHLSTRGRAGFVLSNGSMSTNTRGEKEIRQKMIEADLVDCMVALPPQLFYNTQIPACLWFLNKAKPDHRKEQTLFIDARHLGYLIDRTLRD